MNSSIGVSEDVNWAAYNYPCLHDKKVVLNYLLRKYSIADSKTNKLVEFFSDKDYNEISYKTKIEKGIVRLVAEQFLKELYFFLIALKENMVTWEYESDKLTKKTQLLAYRYYRMTRAFDYKRVRRNIETLHKVFTRGSFWPKLTTQVAVAIFITDKISGRKDLIIQKNIQTMCSCSAYAFHRTRNKIEKLLQRPL
ncbi:MAG: hypothetical protein ACTSR8_14130 [Promethearchaeota archaeon]